MHQKSTISGINLKKISGEGAPHPTPLGAFGASIRPRACGARPWPPRLLILDPPLLVSYDSKLVEKITDSVFCQMTSQ